MEAAFTVLQALAILPTWVALICAGSVIAALLVARGAPRAANAVLFSHAGAVCLWLWHVTATAHMVSCVDPAINQMRLACTVAIEAFAVGGFLLWKSWR